MLTIDWKDRLNKDTAEYLEQKLPKNDYDFEIIFIAFPERINGKIPSDVIVHVANSIVHKIGKNHEKYLPFYKHLWEKKGEHGRMAFIAIMAKLAGKKPAAYMPLIESAVQKFSAPELASLLEKVMLPLLRKEPDKYLSYIYHWSHSTSETVRKQTVGLLVKLLRKCPELGAKVVQHFVNQWLQPLGEVAGTHVLLLKAIAKMDEALYLDIWKQHLHSRDPQSAEILCATIQFYDQDINQIVEGWTKSGNARLKKAALTAQRVLTKKEELNMDLSVLVTKAGMEKIQGRINVLMSERPEVLTAIAIAREFGDLSENAEYKAARERQRQIDSEIDHLRRRSVQLKVVDISAFPKDKIRFGSICRTLECETGEETCYQVIGVDELNYFDTAGIQAVSVLSPIGKALLGKSSGESTVVHAPMGQRQFKIIEIL